MTIPYIPTTANDKIRRAGRYDRREPAPIPASTTNSNALLSSLQATVTSLAKAVCTCIETPLPCVTAQASTTVQTTSSVTATISVVLTVADPVTALATVYTVYTHEPSPV
jgi:hypothetical protein